MFFKLLAIVVTCASIIFLSIASNIFAITQTIKAEQIKPTFANIDNYKPKLKSSFAGVKQPNPTVFSNTTTSTPLTKAATINSILITTTKMQPKTLLLPVEQKLMMITDEMTISNFNENPLQTHEQEHQKGKKQLDGASASAPPTSTQRPQQRHFKCDQYTFNNKHPPCDHIEHAASSIDNENINDINNVTSNNTIAITNSMSNNMGNLFKSSQIREAAKGYKPLGSTSNSVNRVVENKGTSTVNGSNDALSSSSKTPPTMMTTTTTAFNVARNGFRDKINISNQRNEFSNVDDDSNYQSLASNDVDDVVAGVQPHQQQLLQFHRNNRRSPITTTSTTTSTTAESSFFERAELLESNLSPDEHHELLLHRRKRYLVFPEGSSFQLVFDLIIGVVDYTSYAILGITCSVAWELPSKPPSEIIENFRDKLNDGSFGLQRRNDTIANGKLQYVDTSTIGSSSNITQKPTDQTQMAASSKFANFGNDENAWRPQFTVSNFNNKPTSIASSFDKGSGSSSSSSFYKTATNTNDFADAGGDNFAVEAQRKTLNEKWPPSLKPPEQQYGNWLKSNANTKSYSNKNTWNFEDKGKYATADWHRQWPQQYPHPRQPYQQRLSPSSKGSSSAGGFFDNIDGSDNGDYMPDRFAPYQRKQQTNYAGIWQQKDNWWQRNKQRLQTKWQDKQQAWTDYKKGKDESTWNAYTPKRPVTDYARPTFNSYHGYSRTGRHRKILTAPPKHRIYPVFGRRKRSLTYEEKPLTAFEVEMELIHFRQQLESRVKLFGKIEQIFKTRGHNGTECMLRALCETGQRQHQLDDEQQNQLYHHHHRHQQHEHQRPQQQKKQRYNRQPHSTTGQHREPQSFITELLRAIFALPKDILQDENKNARHGGSGSGNSNGNGRHKSTKDNAGSTSGSASQLDFELKLKQHQRREFVSQIPGHYRAAHTYTGDCALRFASCELSIWQENFVAFDNGFGFGYGTDASTPVQAQAHGAAATGGHRT